VLAAVEAERAAPVLAQRSQPRLPLRALLVELGCGSQAGESEKETSWHFKSQSSASNWSRRWYR